MNLSIYKTTELLMADPIVEGRCVDLFLFMLKTEFDNFCTLHLRHVANKQ